MDSELLVSLIEAISVLNQSLKDLESDVDETKSEINSFENDYDKEKKLLHERIDSLNVQIYKTIQTEIKKLPIAINGKDGKDYDSVVAKALLKAEINKLVKQRNLETEKIKSEVLQAVKNIQVPKGRDGRDAKEVTDLQISNALSLWIDDNFDRLKGDDGKSVKGKDGRDGIDGEDGRGIVKAEIKNDYLIITYSDDTEDKIKLPKQKVLVGGGGGSIDTSKYDSHVSSDELLHMFNSTYKTSYSELIYVDGNITQINVYINDTKTTKLFTKEILYSDGNIETVTITNNISNQSIIKTISYLDGNITNISVA
jgi:hypothetical protein